MENSNCKVLVVRLLACRGKRATSKSRRTEVKDERIG